MRTSHAPPHCGWRPTAACPQVSRADAESFELQKQLSEMDDERRALIAVLENHRRQKIQLEQQRNQVPPPPPLRTHTHHPPPLTHPTPGRSGCWRRARGGYSAWQTRHALRVLDEELHAAKEAFSEIKHELQAQVQSGFSQPAPADRSRSRPDRRVPLLAPI